MNNVIEKEVDIIGYENLANAIVEQAARDYKHAHVPAFKESIRKFFKSEWFSILTKIDGNWLLEKLDMEQSNNNIW